MITRVKVRPMTEWCPAIKEDATLKGVTKNLDSVEIYTESMMEKSDSYPAFIACGGRIWMITAKSADEHRALNGIPEWGEVAWMCEHMLEMD